MENIIKKLLPYVGYYALASLAGIAFLFQLWIGVLILDEPKMITSGNLIGMGLTSVITLGIMLFLATRKLGYASLLTSLSLFLCCAITIPFLFQFLSLGEWHRIGTLKFLLTVTCFFATIINGPKLTRNLN
ncbi:hypothetical protein F9U64_20605 [Gracilibacillus oryzae]|uniref:Uncharacterized protein n=1 Tax=Gracilibacillus oryzae TaxID=1672701 RepID=A0A7C8KPI6_9BACI|nr:hypothetical protein [Gracilibacillus oryzae]KAB8126104.1 hypothetical protein F9U64_20605 [Gracilibacillus oryzae]